MNRSGTRVRKILAVLLAAMMAFSVLPMSVFAAVDLNSGALPKDNLLVSKTDYQIAPGIEETHLVLNNADGTDQNHIHAMTVDVNNGTASLIASYKDQDGTKFGLQTVTDQAAAAEAKRGVTVVGGVNGDIFNMQTGASSGMLIMDGALYNQHGGSNPTAGRPYFAILNDGSAVIRQANEPYNDVKEAIGLWEISVMDGKNVSGANGSYNVDPQPRVAVGIKADGSVVVLENDGRQNPYSIGMSWSEIADVLISLGCVVGGQLDGGGSATFVSKRSGEAALTVKNSPSDGNARAVSSALLVTSSAKPDGVFAHAILEPNNEVYTPGSTVQFTATGADSSGAAVALPEDGAYALADSSFGSITADGLFTSNGTAGTVTVNYISGGEVCGNVSIEIRDPDTFYVPTAEISLGFEETTDFGIVAYYQNREVHMKAGDIAWTMVDDEGQDVSETAGTFNADGLTFTTFDGVTVNANVTAAYAKDPSIAVQVRAIIGAMPTVLYDFEYSDDQEEVDASLADDDPSNDLKYIPSLQMPNTEDGTYQQFYDAGYPLCMWVNDALNDKHDGQLTIVSKEDGEPVRFGDHSLRFDYNFETYNGSMNANFYMRMTDPDYAFEGSPTGYGCWVYLPEGMEGVHLYLNCANQANDPVNGFNLAYAEVGDITKTGWQYVEMDFTDPNAGSGLGPANAPYGYYQGCGVFWVSFQRGAGLSTATSGTIYIDNIQLVYGANTDDINNPEITSIGTYGTANDIEIVDNETVLTSNVNTFRATFQDFDGKYATGIDFDAVKMLIDGVDVTDKCFINEGDQELYFYDACLPNGPHRLTMSVSDLFGNNTTETRTFTIDGDREDPSVAFVAEDASPELGSTYTMAITADDAAAIAAADVEIQAFSSFIDYWTDYTIVPSANYQLVGESSAAPTLPIRFAVERKADADPSLDDGTIARIVVSVANNTPEGLAVTYRIDKGALTYTSPVEDEKFTSSFTGTINATVSSPFIITLDPMIVGSAGGNIIVTDAEGNPAAGVEVYTTDGTLVGTTDTEGKVFTNMFVGSVMSFSIYAKQGSLLSFIYKGQSYPGGASADGMPTFVKLNASEDPATSQSISWMSSPLASGAAAVVKYATAADFAAKGSDALITVEGTSIVSEMASSGNAATNYAVRINSVFLTDLTPNTEYVYFAGDGTLMTAEAKTFTTAGGNQDTNFFIIGDTQATDTTNTSLISQSLANSGIAFDFGIQTGDAVDNGGNYAMWEGIAKVFSDDFLGSQDMIHVLGNHEYYGDTTAHNSAAYFELPGTENGTAPLCYSVEYNNVYVAVINYAGADSYREAAQWIIEDAAQSDATWKVLTMHVAPYYTNPAGGSEAVREIISDLVDAADIDFVFSGHDHSYARTEPMTGGEIDRENGAVYYICGSTGEKSYEIVFNPLHHYAFTSDNFNATYLTVNATDEDFTVTTYDLLEDGSAVILDAYTMHKDITCAEGVHSYNYDRENNKLVCAVCGYTTEVGTYTGFVNDASNGKKMYLYLGMPRVNEWYVPNADEAYYFDADGYALTGKAQITEVVTTPWPDEIPMTLFDGNPTTLTYTFDEEGKLIRGADAYDNGARYYVVAGTIRSGWYYLDGDWYQFDGVRTPEKFGKALTGLWTRSYKRYESDSDGKLIRGFVDVDENGTRYEWAGQYVTGWYDVDGWYWCYDEDLNLIPELENKRLTGERYFDPETGYMATGETEIDGKVYAFDDDGALLHEGAHVDENGDGVCDLCDDNDSDSGENFFTRLFNSILDMFRTIIEFFNKLFNAL